MEVVDGVARHPRLIGKMVALARAAGAKIVIGHGETLVEPVPAGTNRARYDVRCT